MIIHDLGPLGCIPSQRVKSKQHECLKRVNEWVLVFNDRIRKLVASLNQQLPGARLMFADTYPTVLDLITNPTTYGDLTSPLLILIFCINFTTYNTRTLQVSKFPTVHAVMLTQP